MSAKTGIGSVNDADVPLTMAALAQDSGLLKAPIRAGFHNEIIVGQGDDSPSTHINISKLYFDEQYVPDYRYNSYVGDHRDDGVTPEAPSNANGPPSTAPSATPIAFGFLDGDFDVLGQVWTEALQTDLTPTGDLLIDYFFETVVDPAAILANAWGVEGDVRLDDVGNGDFAVRMNGAAGGTSISQFMLLPPQAAAVKFDLGVTSTPPGGTLSVLLNGVVLGEIDLSAVTDSHQSIALPPSAGTSGTVAFLLNDPTGGTAGVMLDNLTIAVDNQAPTLTAMQPELPAIASTVDSAANQGIALSSLAANLADADAGTEVGIAIVGAHSQHGAVQYSLDGGQTWRNVGPVSDSQALLLRLHAGSRVRLAPNANFAGTIEDLFTYRAWDRTTGLAGLSGDYVDASQVGGSTPFSANVDSASIVVVLAGDFDQDDDVDGADFLAWQRQVGSGPNAVPLEDWTTSFGIVANAVSGDGDFNGDTIVDGADFLLWQRGVSTVYDGDDLADWKAGFGASAEAAVSAAVMADMLFAEPSAAAMDFAARSTTELDAVADDFARLHLPLAIPSREFAPLQRPRAQAQAPPAFSVRVDRADFLAPLAVADRRTSDRGDDDESAPRDEAFADWEDPFAEEFLSACLSR